MCGIVGLFFPGWAHERRQYAVGAGADALSSRGPDDRGVWAGEHGIALGHRRLAILDLSPLGHQPMVSPETGNVLVYNGEIYNFREIRSELEHEGISFQSSGDTEVLLKAIDHWGLERTLPKCNGMFALGVWQPKVQVLQIARDRVGIKPLYYGWTPEGFLFGSELKAFSAVEGFRMPLNYEALSLFLEHGTVPAPYSIFSGISKLLPGTTLLLTRKQLEQRPDNFSPYAAETQCSPVSFWKVPFPDSSPPAISYEEGVEHLEELLRSSLQLRMISDVPVGAFLSGGIDSSAVVALLSASGGNKVKTFSIGFSEEEFNEAPYAKQIAEHLGTDHTELYLPERDALEVVPELPDLYDEPFADSSQIPTLLVSRLARQEVTVALSGDGGDELFRGYPRYLLMEEIWQKLRRLPRPLRSLFTAVVHRVPMRRWDDLYGAIESILPRSFRGMRYIGLKAHRLGEVMHVRSLRELYSTVNTHWQPPLHPMTYYPGKTVLSDEALPEHFHNPYDFLSHLDMCLELPDDILTKCDRASMSCSLEMRVPLLDHRVVEFARQIPATWCIRDGVQKVILRDILKKYVPNSLFERPKSGFGIPLPHWLRGELREWGETLLSPEHLPEGGYLNREMICTRWRHHQEKKIDAHYPLWTILQFLSWRERWKKHIIEEPANP
ncbi:asparagine synthase (glutamine-hydrolyzing) [bacterium]|nr:asparagine synthase (glutamine-hydrolyzing) [bacterium]